jgi:tRNA A-37 threonylcarbamoyl transferase component Bud32
VLATAHDVAAALRCCHEQGVLHGNLTAGNVQLAGMGDAASWDERGFQAKVRLK